MTSQMPSGHSVYQMFDAHDRLIYVGRTNDLPTRMHKHRYSAWWFPQVARVETEEGLTFSKASSIERGLISTLWPRWNIAGRGYRYDLWSRQNFIDYAIAALRGRVGIKGVAARYATRFDSDLYADANSAAAELADASSALKST